VTGAYSSSDKRPTKAENRKPYVSPRLIHFGCVNVLTQANGSPGFEANCGNARDDAGTRPCSDRRAKENIVRLGTHPLGIGLYLFDYKPEFRDQWGHGRRLGVMADEVEEVLPEAVLWHPNGHKIVDHALLGISTPAD
jgi:hypothetical protein